MNDLRDSPRLELKGVGKAYPAVVANDNVDLTVMPGRIHAVLGENGAGKSTLMKIIYGVVKPDRGTIRFDGRPITVDNPARARRLGIDMVFQHFSLFETLTVAQNIALSLPKRLTHSELGRRIVEVSEQYGLPVAPGRDVLTMSVGERQRVEIVRCLLQNPRLLIMDEPTSVLTPQAVRKLFTTLRKIAKDGCSILYISHKLDEVRELCDTATIMRGGKVVASCDPRVESTAAMARMMIGGELPRNQKRETNPVGDPQLVVHNLNVECSDPFSTPLHDIQLTVRGGEIVGIAGISGNGQRELLWSLSGEKPLAESGVVFIRDTDVSRAGPRERRRLGLRFIPEERLGRGAVPGISIAANAMLTANGHDMVRRSFIRFGAVESFARRCIEEFDVKCSGPGAIATSLSGGNLQKFIVGREILQAPRLLIVAQPTWGVDIGAASFIRRTLLQLRNAGTAILLISEELDELFEVSDRIAVIARGRLSPAIPLSETNLEQIGLAMTGTMDIGPGPVSPVAEGTVSCV